MGDCKAAADVSIQGGTSSWPWAWYSRAWIRHSSLSASLPDGPLGSDGLRTPQRVRGRPDRLLGGNRPWSATRSLRRPAAGTSWPQGTPAPPWGAAGQFGSVRPWLLQQHRRHQVGPRQPRPQPQPDVDRQELPERRLRQPRRRPPAPAGRADQAWPAARPQRPRTGGCSGPSRTLPARPLPATAPLTTGANLWRPLRSSPARPAVIWVPTIRSWGTGPAVQVATSNDLLYWRRRSWIGGRRSR